MQIADGNIAGEEARIHRVSEVLRPSDVSERPLRDLLFDAVVGADGRVLAEQHAALGAASEIFEIGVGGDVNAVVLNR